ncbi:DUF3768 domain-containing protein [Vampirovibrio sp.]|uniref:DUF3768 domain-containing protein n=1 Tax=Vampirovibrio sp. TaxID=2717857 RepID=UPI003593839F
MNSATDSQRIAALNDTFRRSFLGGQVVMTPGVQSLDSKQLHALIYAVQGFDTFNEDNDPYQEHDFGTVTIQGQQFYWKIDCVPQALKEDIL